MRPRAWRARLASARGQSLVEFALVMPVITVLALGVVELSYSLLDQHIVTKLSREGSNLTSRDTSLLSAVNALKAMSSQPVDFTKRSTVILSVIKRVSAPGAANDGKDVLYQRYKFGAIAASSKLTTKGNGVFGPAPDFTAANSNTDVNLQITNLPPNVMVTGGLLYVTEVFSTHTPLVPLGSFGFVVPGTFYSVAYF